MPVEIVFTERPSELTDARAANYARLHERVAAASGQPVQTAYYEQVDPLRLAHADSIVLSGSSAPWSVHDPAELDRLGTAVLSAGRPVLGICAGMQLLARFAGGDIGPSREPQRGFLPIQIHDRGDLLRDLPDDAVVFHDHDHEVTALPEGFRVLAATAGCAVQAIASSERRWWGTQFHPEEFDAAQPDGAHVLRAFFSIAA